MMKRRTGFCAAFFVLAGQSAHADIGEKIEFTDPNCCVLQDVKLANEMTVAPGPFPTGETHYQKAPTNPPFVGELRGAYGNNWHPRQSTFGKTRGTKYHLGVDIYAPSNQQPLLPGIVAPVGGELSIKPADGGALGNRVWIKFSFQNQPYRMILGHLSKFEGSNRTVKAGEVIGYAGCTGNADYDGYCTKPSTCGLTTGHVHIKLVNDATGKVYDPIKALRWKLAYQTDSNRVSCQ